MIWAKLSKDVLKIRILHALCCESTFRCVMFNTDAEMFLRALLLMYSMSADADFSAPSSPSRLRRSSLMFDFNSQSNNTVMITCDWSHQLLKGYDVISAIVSVWLQHAGRWDVVSRCYGDGVWKRNQNYGARRRTNIRTRLKKYSVCVVCSLLLWLKCLVLISLITFVNLFVKRRSTTAII